MIAAFGMIQPNLKRDWLVFVGTSDALLEWCSDALLVGQGLLSAPWPMSAWLGDH